MSPDDVYNHLKVYEPEKTGKKITIQGSDVAGFDKSKVKCFNFYKMGHFAREWRSPRSQDRRKRGNNKKDPKEAEALKNHALVADEEEVPTEYALMAKNELGEVKKEKESIDFKMKKFENSSEDIDRLLGSQKLDKDMKVVGLNEYCAVQPPPEQKKRWKSNNPSFFKQGGLSGNVVSKPMIK
nr:hypothetical protein [Tanacetum cinerariifolium]